MKFQLVYLQFNVYMYVYTHRRKSFLENFLIEKCKDIFRYTDLTAWFDAIMSMAWIFFTSGEMKEYVRIRSPFSNWFDEFERNIEFTRRDDYYLDRFNRYWHFKDWKRYETLLFWEWNNSFKELVILLSRQICIIRIKWQIGVRKLRTNSIILASIV